MDDLVQFLRARLDEDALWATEASRDGDNVARDGVHWRWVSNDTDTEIAPDPSREATIGEEAEEAVSLRSREEWSTTSGVGPLPQFALYADEVLSAVGGHIVRHDPARILAEVDAKRRLLELCSPPLVEVTGPGDGARQFVPGEGKPWGDDVLRLLALPYASHRDYREDWRP